MKPPTHRARLACSPQAGREDRELHAISVEQRAHIDVGISRLRKLVQETKVLGLPGGEVHRLDSYVNMLGVSFERLVNIKEYRTPRALRSYSRVFIILMGALYGPDYLSLAGASSRDAQLAVAIVYACIIQVRCARAAPKRGTAARKRSLAMSKRSREHMNECMR